MNAPAIGAEYLTRFEQGVAGAWADGGRLGLAVSGGADSMAVLLLCHNALYQDFEVATVNHGLRPEAAAECALVAKVCDALSIPCEVLSVEVDDGNRQAEARKARYKALGNWAIERGLDAIATAHHADDQAETLMMRLNRGSGLAGMAGIRANTRIDGCAVPVVRPLLNFRRRELQEIVSQAQVPFVDDPSNYDHSYDRVRMRQALADADWLDPLAVSQTAAHLAEAESTLQSLADRYWREHAVRSDAEVRVPYTGWRDTNARLLKRSIAEFGGEPSRGEIDALMERLVDPKSRANLAGVLVVREQTEFVVKPEPPRRTG